MTLMKAKKPLALLLALLAALSLLGTTALAAGLPEETIAAQTELCGEDCGHTHEEVFSQTEHTEESLPEPEEIAVPVATPLLEQPEPEAGQPSDTSGVIPGSGIYWELNEYGWLMLSGNGSCPTFVSPDDQPWAAVREQITQVWFEDMDALCIPSLAYWFTGCTALTMAEIPYTTPVIGAAAFADCPSLRQIQLYYSGAFTIVPGAFSTGSLTPLLVLFIPEYDSVLGTLAAYDWTEDRRAAYFEDVYGITLLATGYCSNCKRTCSYTVEYEQWTNSEHCVRHWCSNCGYDQAGGVNGEAHSFRSGVCSKCGYSNGSGGGGGGGGNVCYHSSTRTSWSGCDWYEYCRSCGALVDYGTSHGTYVYGAWEYYSSSQHRRSYACSDCGEGTYGPYQIASKLKEEKVLIPSAYLARHGEGVNKNKTFKDVYGWGSSTICNILEKREYLGHTINFKTRKHFKDKKSHYVPEDEWTIFENTHEAIIDQQTFDLVQKIRGNVRRYPDGWGEAAPLTGLLYCADCGGKMYVHRTNNGKRISQYTCSQYSKVPVGKLCTTQHRINEDVVLSLVSEMLKAIAEYAKHDRAEFVRVVQEAQSSQQTAEVKKQRTRLATAKQRVSELEVLLCKIYEDNILGKLSDSRYATLDAQYEKEQTELTAEISVLEKAIKSYEKHEKDADRFIALIDKYENFDKLTIAMLNEFIEKILVHERDRKGSIQTTQEVEIYFNFVGRFVPPAFGEVELTPEELEEIRKREERKDRLHQNYLKRKANGKQKEYEERTKAKKKAEIEARKQAIRTEDIARGVFIPVSSLPQLGPRKGA